jgi:hypothetical protein
MRLLVVALAVILTLGAAGCSPAQAALVNDVIAVRGPGDEVQVTHLGAAAGSENPDRWEIGFSTTNPDRLVDDLRHLFVKRDYRIDDNNDGLGFIANDTVEVREIFTTATGTRKILVSIGCCIAQED